MVNEEIIRAKVLIAPGAICHQLDAMRWLAGSKQVTVTPSCHPVGFVTGSNGKTTSKELCLQVLKKKYNTMATSGNLNNHIGVPLSILSIGTDTEIAIIEMGANHKGEIKNLCEIAMPNIGYITTVSYTHLTLPTSDLV